MRIAIDGSRAFSKNPTGTENYSYSVIKSLSKVDTQNNYLIYLRPNQNPGKDWPENFKFKTINYPRLWTQIGLALRTFIDNPDLLFVPSHTLPLIHKPGLKTLVTVHDLGAEYLPGMHQLKQVLYLKMMTHYQLRGATKIIAVSAATKKDLIERINLSPKKIDVIYEAVNKTVFKKIANDTLKVTLNHYNLQKNNYFLFVGTIQPRKNLERLIKAFSQISNQDKKLKLVLVGGKGWKSESIYALSKKLGMEESIKFLGRVGDKDLVGLYNGAICLTYPSLFEGFGLPILEAFACGCPVITSNISSMPEVAGNAAKLVDPYNIEAISKAMEEIAKNEKLRNSMIQKGIIRLGQFDWGKSAKAIVKIIEELGRKNDV